MAQVIGGGAGEVLLGGPDPDLILGLGGDDELRGEDGSDLLDGGPGRDGVFGGEGDDLILGGTAPEDDPNADDDLLDGGEGSDWVIYSSQPLLVDLSQGRAEALFQSFDRLVGIENIAASGVLIGDAGDNVLLGLGTEPDEFRGGAGDDLMIGSDAVHRDSFPGFDTVNYGDDPAGVSVDLSLGEAVDGFGGQDRITGIEAVFGSQFADTLFGDAGPNHLAGLGGADHIEGREQSDLLAGGEGEDALDGGEGADWVFSTGTETIDLGQGTATDLFSGEVDTLVGIENILSFGFDDVLIGDAGPNRFAFSETNSVMTGGEGADRFLQLQPGQEFSLETVTDFERGEDLLQFQADVRSVDQPLEAGPLDPGLFAVGTAADANDLFIFDPALSTLFIDRDGSGDGEAIPTLDLGGVTDLAASDIEIVPADFLVSFLLGGDEVLV
jgi:Ca2+-binding RTX toxin-like protein